MQPAERETAAAFQSLAMGIAAWPRLLETLGAMEKRLASMEAAIVAEKPASAEREKDGWLDAKRAALYLDMSAGTFDKYRYQGNPKITGYKVGGKTLYKREDLDRWVKLYELKAGGFA